MLVRLIKYILGYVLVEGVGAKRERFINLCSARNVSIWEVRYTKDSFSFYIYARDFKLLKDIVKKTEIRLKIKERYGLPFFLFKYRKRKAFFFGVLTAFILVYILSLYVWDIAVDGNYSHSKYELIAFLKENDIYHGIKKQDIDCEAIEKLIRNNYFDITWVSVELRGTRLIVHIKENFYDNSSSDYGEVWAEGCSLVSEKDAVIQSIITRSGKPMVKAGDEVTSGTVLISGSFDVTGDYDQYIRTEQVAADGDIYGLVTYKYEDFIDRQYIKRNYTGRELKYGKLRFYEDEVEISLKKMGFESYDKIENEVQVSIVGDFYVPLYYGTVIYREYTSEDALYTDEELNELSDLNLQYYLENLSKKGIQIVENNVTIEVGENGILASGEIKAVEKLGVPKAIEPENPQNGE